MTTEPRPTVQIRGWTVPFWRIYAGSILKLPVWLLLQMPGSSLRPFSKFFSNRMIALYQENTYRNNPPSSAALLGYGSRETLLVRSFPQIRRSRNPILKESSVKHHSLVAKANRARLSLAAHPFSSVSRQSAILGLFVSLALVDLWRCDSFARMIQAMNFLISY